MSVTPSVLTREAGTSPVPVKPARRRPSLAHILIVLAALLAFVLNYLALQDQGSTSLVAAAAEDLSSGSIIGPASVRLVEVPSDLPGLDGLLGEAERDAVSGWVVGLPISEGEIVPRSALNAPASHDGLRLMSMPVARERAAGGSVGPGDRVDVISVVDGRSGFVATDLEVVEVADTAQGALSAGSSFFLVVAVDSAQALALAEAIDGGGVSVIRSTGAEPLSGGAK